MRSLQSTVYSLPRKSEDRSQKTINAFTLAEVLVVMAILSILGVLFLNIFSRNLRGTNKSQILISLKENGQGVLENMTNIIRNADDLVCISSNPPNTLVVVKNGDYTRYQLVTQQTEANGFIRQDYPTPALDGSESDPRVFIDRVCNPSDPMPKALILTDDSLQKGVSVIAGRFELDKEAGFKDSIKITFSLAPPIKTLRAVAGIIDPVTFETTIQLR